MTKIGTLRPQRLWPLLWILALGILPRIVAAGQDKPWSTQTPHPGGKGGVAEITASGPQRRQGELYLADKDVNLTYQGMHLQADHLEYNNETNQAVARGNVRFDYENEHLEGDEARFNVGTGKGQFRNVRGSIRLNRRANPLVLVSENPLYFEAREIDRLSDDVYLVHHGWFTICDPRSPTWQFYAPEAKVTLEKSVALVNANFRIYRWCGCRTRRRRRARICGNPGLCCRFWGTATARALPSEMRSIGRPSSGLTRQRGLNISANAELGNADRSEHGHSRTPRSAIAFSTCRIARSKGATNSNWRCSRYGKEAGDL